MSILSKLISDFGGNIIKEGFDVVKAYFPPSMSDKEKGDAQLAYERFVKNKQAEANTQALEVDKEFNQRIKDMEGTANDLKTIPYLGGLIIFLRGSLRPFWGWFCAYADYMVFSGTWMLEDVAYRQMLFALNIMVFIFIFGERAVKAVLPFLKSFMGKK
jgi:hypothetical protein